MTLLQVLQEELHRASLHEKALASSTRASCQCPMTRTKRKRRRLQRRRPQLVARVCKSTVISRTLLQVLQEELHRASLHEKALVSSTRASCQCPMTRTKRK